MRDGVEVFKITHDPVDGNEQKQDLGKSAKAGQMAVMQSAASRVLTNMSVSFPSFLLSLSSPSSSSPFFSSATRADGKIVLYLSSPQWL